MAEDNNNVIRAFFNSSVFIEILIGFVVFSTYLFMNQIDALSVHLHRTFNIPVQGISIYLSKSHTARTLIIIISSFIQHLFLTNFTSSIVPLTVISYLFLLLTRLIYLLSLYHSPFLLKYYIINNIEAFFFGFFHIALLSIIMNHLSIALMSMTVSGTFAFLLQRFINGYQKTSPLTMFKIHAWTCVFLSLISFAGLNYYLSYYHRFPPSYISTIDRVKSLIDRFNEVVTDLKTEINALFLNYSMITRINGEIKGLMAEGNRIRDIKGITYEVDVILNVLRDIKDKIDQMLTVIEFGKKMGLTSVYELRVPLRTQIYQQINHGRHLRDFWESLKTYFENVKHVYVFKFKEPIRYESSKYSKPETYISQPNSGKPSPKKNKSTKEEEPKKKKGKGLKKGKNKEKDKDKYKESERVTTPETEEYQEEYEDDSDQTQEEGDQEHKNIKREGSQEGIKSTQGPRTTDSDMSTSESATQKQRSETSTQETENSTLKSESPTMPTENSTTSETPTLTSESSAIPSDPSLETASPTLTPESSVITSETQTQESNTQTEESNSSTSESSTPKPTSDTQATTSDASTFTSETERTSIDVEQSTLGSDSSTVGSETESTSRNVESSKGVQPTETPKTSSQMESTAMPPTTKRQTVKSPVTKKPSTLPQTTTMEIKNPTGKVEKLVLRPQNYVIPGSKVQVIKDDLELKIYSIQVDLNGFKDELIRANNALKLKEGNIKSKEEVLDIIHDVESQIIDMDNRFNQVERALSDKIKYEYHVSSEALKTIKEIQQAQIKRMYQDKNVMKNVFLENKRLAMSLLLMFFTSQLLKEFFFPRTLPLAFSHVPTHDMISVVTIVSMYGVILVLILNRMAVDFKNWNSGYNILWTTILPVVIIFIHTMLGLHTNIQRVRGSFNSEGNVLLMTIFFLTFAKVMELLSYIGVANYVYWQTADVLGNLHYFTLFYASTTAFRFLISKLAIKPEARLSLGYTFRNLPIQLHPGRGTVIFWLMDGFKSSTKELMGDLVSNIRRYI